MRKTLIALVLIAILAPAGIVAARGGGTTRLDEWKQWNAYQSEEQARDARLRAIQEEADRLLGNVPDNTSVRPGSPGNRRALPRD